MKEKLSQESVSQIEVEEVVAAMHSTFDTIIEKLTHDDDEQVRDEPEFEELHVVYDTEDDLSISSLEGDLPTWMSDDDVAEQEIGVYCQEGPHHQVDEQEELERILHEVDFLNYELREDVVEPFDIVDVALAPADVAPVIVGPRLAEFNI
ncbi:hypothetical protein CTI12_AA549700 [Artemisia annua]|uniref:Uncharacterized protein n=1 Tax=Artemisia annua TaxID=35608 RepID=A0A2U1KYS5_ARTAN|nr:hypothetical protein CTI12_AA549700 [Artemisia annua]